MNISNGIMVMPSGKMGMPFGTTGMPLGFMEWTSVVDRLAQWLCLLALKWNDISSWSRVQWVYLLVKGLGFKWKEQ